MHSQSPKQEITTTSNHNINEDYQSGIKHTNLIPESCNNIESRYYARNSVHVVGSRINDVSISRNSQSNSRVQYSPAPGVVVHEHPSRPVRSPSPAFRNPSASIVPPANFIYNSPTTQIHKVVTVSPQKMLISSPTRPPTPPPPTQSMIPTILYDNCVQECRLWQQKYNQLYSLYIKSQSELTILTQEKQIHNNCSTAVNVSRSINEGLRVDKEEYEIVVRQNKKLKDKIRDLERNNQQMSQNMEETITRLVNKYRDSTLKQTRLLVDRYRLEKKMAEKN